MPHATRPLLHTRKTMLCIWWYNQQEMHYVLLTTSKTSVQIIVCSSWNLCIRRWTRSGQHWCTVPPLQCQPSCGAGDTTRRRGWDVLCYLYYCPDIVPTDYQLFYFLENYLCGKFLTNAADLRQALRDFFASETHDFFFYHQWIALLDVRWQKTS